MYAESTHLGSRPCEALEYVRRIDGTLSILTREVFRLLVLGHLGLIDLGPCWATCLSVLHLYGLRPILGIECLLDFGLV